jgi:hypothetical protein
MLRKALALGLILGLGLSRTLVVLAGMVAEDPPAIPGSPYSAVAVTQSTTTFSDGNRIVRTNTVRYFRDGQGRTRVERGIGSDGVGNVSQSNLMIVITDPVGGELYLVRPQSKSVDAMKMTPQVAAAQAAVHPPTDGQVPFGLLGINMALGASLSTEAATAETSLGQKTVNGVTATGTRVVRTFPPGVLGNEKPITSTVEEWFSSDLGVPVQITQKSSIGGEISLNLTQVVHGEPDSTLFAPPAGYTVRQAPAAMGAMVTGTAVAGSATVTATATASPR